ncbi:putative Biotin-requiring enzyme [Leishmania naiffi]|uniref:Biotin-requiring enzyme n=1 Tax=Leishmania naiffi TaxID=5678 RepID=A0AAW3BPR5_9TRYP
MMRRTLLWLVNFEPVFMPALSPSMERGTVVEWKKKVGDVVNENDVFCTIQTDKAVVDYTNTFESGYLAKIYCENGQSAPVAKTIAVMVSDAADVEKASNYYPEDAATAPAAAADAVQDPPVSSAAPAKHYGGSIDAAVAASGPSVTRIVAGLEPSALAGIAPSGKGGRFLKSDFSDQPGFKYSDAAPARVTQRAVPAAAAGDTSKTTAKSVAGTAVSGGIYDVVLKPGPAYKSVSDTALLNKLIHAMYVPKPNAKKAAK